MSGRVTTRAAGPAQVAKGAASGSIERRNRESVAGDAPRLRAACWVEPRLVAEIRFTEWTANGKLRHPAFQGLRADKVALSNPGRVLYPRDGLIKQDVADGRSPLRSAIWLPTGPKRCAGSGRCRCSNCTPDIPGWIH